MCLNMWYFSCWLDAMDNKLAVLWFQFSNSVWVFATPWTAACQVSLSITNSWSFTNPCPSWRWCPPTISSSLSSPSSPAFNLSQDQGLFQWVSSSHQVAKYWSFSLSISPSNEYSGLISFRIDCLDILAVQVFSNITLQKHQFFGAQLSL